MIKFGIIGIAGFVAKKHLNCIKKMKGELVAAYDKHDNVGFVDKHYPKANFFKNEDQFFSFIKKKKIKLYYYLLSVIPSL
jgi:UDP-N-acetyl-2-amino-2-deoxyglucuronate dehydrogenase